MRVYGYIRVSSEEQATSGQSLETQREKVRAYCQLHDLDLVELLEDAGCSAKNLKRSGIQTVLDGLRNGDAEGLVIHKLDRLSRSVRDWSHLIERYFSEKAGFSLLSVEDSIDTRTAGGRLVLFVLSAVSQWEREAIGERTRAVLQSKIKRGEPVGSAAYGLRIVRGIKDGREKSLALEVDPDQADGLRAASRARELRAEGLSYRAIAERLNAEGHRPERAERFGPQAVWNLVNNPRLAPYVAA